jgi:hypothetical protein
MKALFILFTFLSPLLTEAKEAKNLFICPTFYYSTVKKIVEKYGSYDKYKHCAVSCALALRCPADDVLELGALKELIDVVGPGNAEINDLKADYDGVSLAVSSKAKTDLECINKCHLLYPKPKFHGVCPPLKY